MNGNWTGGMIPIAMMSWAQLRPQFDWPASFMRPFHPQMPQNIQVPVPGQGLLSGAPFSDPGQAQFRLPRPPSVSTAPTFQLGAPELTSTPIHPGPPSRATFPSQPPSVNFLPTRPPSSTSFQPGPPTSFAARAPSTASTSSFPSGPPSASIPDPDRKRPKLSLSPDVSRELLDEESPASQPPPPHVCRLCAGLVPVPPAYSLILDQRQHAKVHSAQAQRRLSEVFPLCFPDAPVPEERDGNEEQEPFQSQPSNSRSAESSDTSLPPPPTTPPPTTPPASIPTSVQPVTTADPSPTTAPSSSKGTKVSQDSEAAFLTSGTQSYSSEDQAKVPSTPTTPFLERENVSGAHICPHCGTSYSTSAFLDRHVHLCLQRPKEFPCPKCPSSFSRKDGLTLHLETVHCPPSHQCHICGKWFTQRGNCTRHVREHSNSNPFKCRLCDFSTLQKSHLTRHMSTHSSQKPFACPLCFASFGENKRLKSHLNKAHSPGQSPLLCPHCGWAFAIKCHLSRHIKDLHKES